MFGERMRRPTDGSVAAAREAAIRDGAGLSIETFASVRAIARARGATRPSGRRAERATATATVSVAFAAGRCVRDDHHARDHEHRAPARSVRVATTRPTRAARAVLTS
jgi:hypothetical protein